MYNLWSGRGCGKAHRDKECSMNLTDTTKHITQTHTRERERKKSKKYCNHKVQNKMVEIETSVRTKNIHTLNSSVLD